MYLLLAAAPWSAQWELEASWARVLQSELEQDYYSQLKRFVDEERRTANVLPPAAQQFAAFGASSFERVKVVILGQDPYPTPGNAHGLSFSVPHGVKVPRSLSNIYKELEADLGILPAAHGNLEAWARQGVLLLNAVLSVRAGEARSHTGHGWETFTGAAIDALLERRRGLVFMLWGKDAQKVGARVDRSAHLVLEAAHPSPFSAHRGFIGCRHFSKANSHLEASLAPSLAPSRTPIILPMFHHPVFTCITAMYLSHTLRPGQW